LPKLPTDAKERKGIPIATGVLDYFPLTMAGIAKASLAGNKQHVPGEPLHWDRSKSSDDADAMIRHYIDRFEIDADGVPECAKMAWRACAVSEKILEDKLGRQNNKVTKWANVFLAEPSVSDPACVRFGNGTLYDTEEAARSHAFPSPGYIGTFPIEITR
jgi:hypothetical protein